MTFEAIVCEEPEGRRNHLANLGWLGSSVRLRVSGWDWEDPGSSPTPNKMLTGLNVEPHCSSLLVYLPVAALLGFRSLSLP